MAVTLTDVKEASAVPIEGGVAGLRLVVKSLALDASYPTGGESITAAMLGLGTVVWLQAQSTGGYVFEYDYTNSKLIARYADYDAGADGALIQVPDTTDLATVVGIRVVAIGTPA